jgi:hypothetical protein
MINNNQPCDPRIHEAAVWLARKCVHIIRAVLREEEVIEATRSFYSVIREGIEEMNARRN